MLIGDKIRRLRKNKGITQTQLAEVLTVSAQSVSKWENHLSAPDISVLPVIARYFGITMDELFDYRLDALNRKERFIRFMVDNGMLRFGEFRLKSGRVSPYHIHSGYSRTGSRITRLGEFYAACIRENNLEGSCLMGVGGRAVQLVIAASMALFHQYGVDAAHCVDDEVEEPETASGDVTLITDVLTSGATLCAALDRIRERTGKYPSDVVVCVDRMERTERSSLSARAEIENRYGVRIHPIVNARDIVRAAEDGVITAGEYTTKLKDYLNRYRGEEA
ncbi:MAG: helix-turn-helix domain-containing protein [Clostridia bacterium]|nr:helix-turn-helix domain-containing protein [Clostridia bacterium]